jgi:hypothetical protein
MATTQSSSTRYSPQDNRELAIKLADACVNPSWAVYFRRFEEVLAAERALAAPVTRWGASSRRPQLMPIMQRRIHSLLTGFSSELIAAARRGFSA